MTTKITSTCGYQHFVEYKNLIVTKLIETTSGPGGCTQSKIQMSEALSRMQHQHG